MVREGGGGGCPLPEIARYVSTIITFYRIAIAGRKERKEIFEPFCMRLRACNIIYNIYIGACNKAKIAISIALAPVLAIATICSNSNTYSYS